MKRILSFLILGVFGLCVSSAWTDAGYHIRVAVLRDAPEIALKARGTYKIIDPQTNATLHEGRRLGKSRVRATHRGIYVGSHYYAYDHIRIQASKDLTFQFRGKSRTYRGALDISKDKRKKLLVVNYIDLERYVKGVLYHEVSDKWPMEAMKAQAVATRSYALYQMNINQDQPYDVTSDIYSQVYGGKKAERFRTSLAAGRTKGEVLLYGGEILPAYFHANSGGHTEDVRELWKHDLAPLYGRADQYAKDAPHFTWKKNFQSSEVQKTLMAHDYDLGLIEEIKVKERNESGRIRLLEIKARDGSRITLTGKKFREIIGPNRIKSNNYEVTMKGYYFDLHGKGWGHGVGMCQWGAHQMAKERRDYEEILSFYYPQTQIIDYRKETRLAKKRKE